MNPLFKSHFDTWTLGAYGEETPLSQHVKTEAQRQEFFAFFFALADTKLQWRDYLCCFAAAAAVYYKNPSFAAFYEDFGVGAAMIRRIQAHGVPKVTEIEQELFDVFVASVEHNVAVHKAFIPVLAKTLSKTSSYREMYNEYMTNYLRLYRHSFKLSSEELLIFRDVIVKKMQELGAPVEDQQRAFIDTAETFEVKPYTMQTVEEEIVTKGFIFSKKEKVIVKKQVLRAFEDVLNELKLIDAKAFR